MEKAEVKVKVEKAEVKVKVEKAEGKAEEMVEGKAEEKVEAKVEAKVETKEEVEKAEEMVEEEMEGVMETARVEAARVGEARVLHLVGREVAETVLRTPAQGKAVDPQVYQGRRLTIPNSFLAMTVAPQPSPANPLWQCRCLACCKHHEPICLHRPTGRTLQSRRSRIPWLPRPW